MRFKRNNAELLRLNGLSLAGYTEKAILRKATARLIQMPIRDDSKPPVIFSVEATHSLLKAALKLDPAFSRYFANGLFASIRQNEIERLKSKYISEQYIEITAANAKCRKRRMIKMNLILNSG